jgi:hypothetical protein
MMLAFMVVNKKWWSMFYWWSYQVSVGQFKFDWWVQTEDGTNVVNYWQGFLLWVSQNTDGSDLCRMLLGWDVVKWLGHMATTDWVTLLILIVAQPSVCSCAETGSPSQIVNGVRKWFFWKGLLTFYTVEDMLNVSEGSTDSIFRVTEFGSVGC